MSRSKKCAIRNCPGTHKSRFGIPEHSFSKWQEAVGMQLAKKSRICGDHFLKDDICDTWTSGQGLTKYTITLKKPRLKDGAIPRLFLNNNALIPKFNFEIDSVDTEPTTSFDKDVIEVNQISNKYLRCSTSSNSDISNTPTYNKTVIKENISTVTSNESPSLFNILLKDRYHVKLPHFWSNELSTSKKPKTKLITFFKLGFFGNRCQRAIEKQLVVTENSEFTIYVLDKKLTIEEQQTFYPTFPLLNITVKDIEKIIYLLDEVNVCYGAALISEFPNLRGFYGPKLLDSNGYWKHVNCKQIIFNNNNVCVWCRRLSYSLKKKKKLLLSGDEKNVYPSTKLKSLKLLKDTNATLRRKVSRANTKIVNLENHIKELRIELSQMEKKRKRPRYLIIEKADMF